MIERFAQFDACAELDDEVWRGECVFLQAERLSRAGDYEGALAACRKGAYAHHCEGHVLQVLAMEHIRAPMPEVIAALRKVCGEVDDKGPELEFWGGFFRSRINLDMAIDAAECEDMPCRNAARHEIGLAAALAIQSLGCAAPFTPAWGASSSATRWIDVVRRRECPP